MGRNDQIYISRNFKYFNMLLLKSPTKRSVEQKNVFIVHYLIKTTLMLNNTHLYIFVSS